MITITWGDWFDDLAGLRDYKYQIHTVSNRDNSLKEDGLLKEGGEGTIHLNETYVSYHKASLASWIFITKIHILFHFVI